METDADAVQEDAEKWTSAMLTLLQQPPVPEPTTTASASAGDPDRGQVRKEDKFSRRGTASAACSGLSREEANKLLDRASLSTMDGCLNVLAAFNVREAMQESE